MAAITIELPNYLAERVRRNEDRLPEILEWGFRELDSDPQHGFEGAAQLLKFLAGLPSPEETLRLKVSERFESRVRELLEKNRCCGLSTQEEEEWKRFEFVNHLVTMAKLKAYIKLGKERAEAVLAESDASAPDA